MTKNGTDPLLYAEKNLQELSELPFQAKVDHAMMLK